MIIYRVSYTVIYYMCHSQNKFYSLYSGMIVNPLIGIYKPIVRIPIMGWMTVADIPCFDYGT